MDTAFLLFCKDHIGLVYEMVGEVFCKNIKFAIVCHTHSSGGEAPSGVRSGYHQK